MAIRNQRKKYAVSTPKDDILTAIGRQLSDHYMPTVHEPPPSELRNLVIQLVALEILKRGSRNRGRLWNSLPHRSPALSVDR
jgi:hypothetical protein